LRLRAPPRVLDRERLLNRLHLGPLQIWIGR
jgi:hypothetical protein